ncbi:MAG: glycosyltransferase family 4 protein [Saprospiraceae bacterium]|nr:glycosyltransferase family 4 protein [Saprospiraceae bacterium]
MKVIVAQPNKQYCNELLKALQQQQYLARFYTLLASNKMTLLQNITPNAFKGELRKRTFHDIPPDLIHHFPTLLVYHKLMTGDITSKVKSSFKFFDQAVAKALRREMFDLVISYENANLYTFQAAKEQGKTTVLDLAQVHHQTIREIHEIVSLEKNLTKEKLEFVDDLKQQALAVTDYTLTLSGFAKSTLVDNGMAAENIFVANLGINPALFTPKTTWNANSKLTFLFVGTMTSRKGIDLLLKVFKELRLPNVELLLVGPMADAKDLMQQYSEIFTYIPFLHHEDLVKYYQKADVFVFPSYLDSWAQTVIEAMACGTPAIVTVHTGAKDAVEQGGGFVIPINDAEALKEKILFFVENRTAIEEMGRRAHEIAQQYTWQNYYAQIVAAIETIANKEGIAL